MTETTIKTEGSVVVLSRESYDMMRAMQTASNLRGVELAKQRDKFERWIIKTWDAEKSNGYSGYVKLDDVLRIYRDVFEIVPDDVPPVTVSDADEDVEKTEAE